MLKITDIKTFIKFAGLLAKEFEVIGPKKLADKGVFYSAVTGGEDLYLGDEFTVDPVKKLFLAPSEWLYKNKFEDGNTRPDDMPPPETKRIIIGVRPCEARGLELLDKVFCSEYKDRSYSQNRQRSVLVGLACAKPDRSCFCASLGGSPVETRALDAVLFAAGEPGDKLLLEILTGKGKEIFASLGELAGEEDQKTLKLEKEKRKAAAKKIKVPETLDGIFESSYWENISRPCLSCGICTYLCPTCHCFDLIDEERKRLRCYDGCSFKEFTLEASGENPRPAKKERYRQRVFHKFDYFKKNFGENLCVGCGRCIRHCPVKMDISEIVSNAPSAGSR